jgi:hypothetical protein
MPLSCWASRTICAVCVATGAPVEVLVIDVATMPTTD